MPLIMIAPAVVLSVVCMPITRIRIDWFVLRAITFLLAYAFVFEIIFRIYLGFTGQEWAFPPNWKTGEPFYVAAFAMGVIAAYRVHGSNNSLKSGTPQSGAP